MSAAPDPTTTTRPAVPSFLIHDDAPITVTYLPAADVFVVRIHTAEFEHTVLSVSLSAWAAHVLTRGLADARPRVTARP